jgi:hypothetical protein
MNTYIGTKIINAKPMTLGEYNDLRGWTTLPDGNPAKEGYLVEYTDGGTPNHSDFDGYISWSPKEVFERAYRLVEGITFGAAIEAMKLGKRVARADWNKGMNLQIVSGMIVLSGWLASQTDMLSEDWYIIE